MPGTIDALFKLTQVDDFAEIYERFAKAETSLGSSDHPTARFTPKMEAFYKGFISERQILKTGLEAAASGKVTLEQTMKQAATVSTAGAAGKGISYVTKKGAGMIPVAGTLVATVIDEGALYAVTEHYQKEGEGHQTRVRSADEVPFSPAIIMRITAMAVTESLKNQIHLLTEKGAEKFGRYMAKRMVSTMSKPKNLRKLQEGRSRIRAAYKADISRRHRYSAQFTVSEEFSNAFRSNEKFGKDKTRVIDTLKDEFPKGRVRFCDLAEAAMQHTSVSGEVEYAIRPGQEELQSLIGFRESSLTEVQDYQNSHKITLPLVKGAQKSTFDERRDLSSKNNKIESEKFDKEYVAAQRERVTKTLGDHIELLEKLQKLLRGKKLIAASFLKDLDESIKALKKQDNSTLEKAQQTADSAYSKFLDVSVSCISNDYCGVQELITSFPKQKDDILQTKEIKDTALKQSEKYLTLLESLQKLLGGSPTDPLRSKISESVKKLSKLDPSSQATADQIREAYMTYAVDSMNLPQGKKLTIDKFPPKLQKDISEAMQEYERVMKEELMDDSELDFNLDDDDLDVSDDEYDDLVRPETPSPKSPVSSTQSISESLRQSMFGKSGSISPASPTSSKSGKLDKDPATPAPDSTTSFVTKK